MTVAMVATGIVFFPVAPLFLLMHGKPVEIPKGTEATAFVQGDMRLEMKKMVFRAQRRWGWTLRWPPRLLKPA